MPNYLQKVVAAGSRTTAAVRSAIGIPPILAGTLRAQADWPEPEKHTEPPATTPAAKPISGASSVTRSVTRAATGAPVGDPASGQTTEPLHEEPRRDGLAVETRAAQSLVAGEAESKPAYRQSARGPVAGRGAEPTQKSAGETAGESLATATRMSGSPSVLPGTVSAPAEVPGPQRAPDQREVAAQPAGEIPAEEPRSSPPPVPAGVAVGHVDPVARPKEAKRADLQTPVTSGTRETPSGTHISDAPPLLPGVAIAQSGEPQPEQPAVEHVDPKPAGQSEGDPRPGLILEAGTAESTTTYLRRSVMAGAPTTPAAARAPANGPEAEQKHASQSAGENPATAGPVMRPVLPDVAAQVGRATRAERPEVVRLTDIGGDPAEQKAADRPESGSPVAAEGGRQPEFGSPAVERPAGARTMSAVQPAIGPPPILPGVQRPQARGPERGASTPTIPKLAFPLPPSLLRKIETTTVAMPRGLRGAGRQTPPQTPVKQSRIQSAPPVHAQRAETAPAPAEAFGNVEAAASRIEAAPTAIPRPAQPLGVSTVPPGLRAAGPQAPAQTRVEQSRIESAPPVQAERAATAPAPTPVHAEAFGNVEAAASRIEAAPAAIPRPEQPLGGSAVSPGLRAAGRQAPAQTPVERSRIESSPLVHAQRAEAVPVHAEAFGNVEAAASRIEAAPAAIPRPEQPLGVSAVPPGLRAARPKAPAQTPLEHSLIQSAPPVQAERAATAPAPTPVHPEAFGNVEVAASRIDAAPAGIPRQEQPLGGSALPPGLRTAGPQAPAQTPLEQSRIQNALSDQAQRAETEPVHAEAFGNVEAAASRTDAAPAAIPRKEQLLGGSAVPRGLRAAGPQAPAQTPVEHSRIQSALSVQAEHVGKASAQVRAADASNAETSRRGESVGVELRPGPMESVPLPEVSRPGGSKRESTITIGRMEVQVNNQAPPPARPARRGETNAPASGFAGAASWDRFLLRL